MSEPNQCRILLIERELAIALMIEDMLVDLGHDVVRAACGFGDAIALAESGFGEVAILDAEWPGDGSRKVAAILARRGIPVVLTAYGRAPVGTAPPGGAATLTKPFQMADLTRVLAQVSHASA